jgi:hypothetical protein
MISVKDKFIQLTTYGSNRYPIYIRCDLVGSLEVKNTRMEQYTAVRHSNGYCTDSVAETPDEIFLKLQAAMESN